MRTRPIAVDTGGAAARSAAAMRRLSYDTRKRYGSDVLSHRKPAD